MKYTKNISNELILIGFLFKTSNDDTDDIEYDVYQNNYIEVTIDHTNQKVFTYINIEDDINISSIENLKKLMSVLSNKKKPTEYLKQLY